MTCAGCARNLEKSIAKVPGVTASQVNFAVKTGQFGLESPAIAPAVEAKIAELGFTIRAREEDFPTGATGAEPEGDKAWLKFTISIVLALMIFALAMWPLKGWPNETVNGYLQLLLCAPIWGWVGLKFQQALLRFIRSGQSNMNTLIGLGTTAAFAYSAVITLLPSFAESAGLSMRVYYEAVGFIISFVYLGQYLEEKAKTKTTEALNALLSLSAKTATIVVDGELKSVAISAVQVGDLIRVKPGEKIPVDGQVVSGSSAIDEAMISGEPLPVVKGAGEPLFAGTINGDGAIDYRADKVGADTLLAQIITFVENAQNTKPRIQRFADAVSGVFTPIVIVIAIVTFIGWYVFGSGWGPAIANFIAVLVIACPCALGLATPTAVVVATGRASLQGLLIGGGEVIEKAVGIDTIIFDKTGTLTAGTPTVIAAKVQDDAILGEVAAIEQLSEHPLAKAIIAYGLPHRSGTSEPKQFAISKGRGVTALMAECRYHIGSEAYLAEQGITLEEPYKPAAVGSLVYIARDEQHVGTLVVGDELKPSAKPAIAALKQRGITTWLITGDNQRVAEAVAKELAIDHLLADALPLAKAAKLEELQSAGRKVAMIGDGINDAPALAKAHLSIAMGTGTDVAINASDVTIVKGDIGKAVDFIALAEGTMAIIKQNLFLSFVYNVLLIPIAAGALAIFGGPMMPPVLASMAMALSSISVVMNSLRIRALI